MKYLIYIISIFLISLNIRCHISNVSPLIKGKTDDTTKAISILFNENFLSRNMSGFGAPGIEQKSIYGDTILFEINDSLNRYIPERLDNHYLKRISRDSLCQLTKSVEKDSIIFPHFMKLAKFQKIDSGYEAILEATCVFPDINISNKAFDKSSPCIFGMLCGGGIYVEFRKKGDSMLIVRKSSWSD